MDYYSSIAEGYDELHGEEQDSKLRQFLGKIEMPKRCTVLDVGCGTGRSFSLLGDVIWNGIDPSKGLIARAEPEVRSKIKVGKAENLPYGDASYDIVISLTALQNFDDPKKGLEEMRRVCKPGGLLLISFLKKSKNRGVFGRLMSELFMIDDSWEQEKDLMYIARTQPI